MKFLDGLSQDKVGEVLAGCRRPRFAAQQVIFHEGDRAEGMHVIVTGLVAVKVTTPSGSTATLDIVGPGDPVGELALVTPNGIRSASAIALRATDTIALSRSMYAELRATIPGLTDNLLTVLAERQRATMARLAEALFVPVEARLARRILDLTPLFGEPDAGQPVVITLNQNDLADLAGTTRETANRVLRHFAEDGMVSLGRGQLTLVDDAALRLRAHP
jgi:CRP/FNR family transcriptional regulator, cyclic AMP receptor protein